MKLKKFVKELIFVLQSQNEVFGILFSTLHVHIYRAKRGNMRDIIINHDVRSLITDFDAD